MEYDKERIPMNDTMQSLYSVVLDRKANPQEGSYT